MFGLEISCGWLHSTVPSHWYPAPPGEWKGFGYYRCYSRIGRDDERPGDVASPLEIAALTTATHEGEGR